MQTNIITDLNFEQYPIEECYEPSNDDLDFVYQTFTDDTLKDTIQEHFSNPQNRQGLSYVPNLNTLHNEAESNPKNEVEKLLSMADYLRAGTTVKAIELYKSDAKVIRVSDREHTSNNDVKRGQATEVSKKSLENLRFLASNTSVVLTSIITLTYPKDYPSDGKAVKKMLNSLLTRMRRKFGDFSYIWVIEFQVRGAPHYHIITGIDLAKYGELTTMRRGGKRTPNYKTNLELHGWLAETWNRIVFSNKYWTPNENDKGKHLRAGTSWEVIREKDGAAKYMAKYACKPHQKQIPSEYQDIGRAWGASRNVKENCKPITKIECGEFTAIDLLSKAMWKGCEFIKKVGYLPKHLYGVGKLLITELTQEADEYLQTMEASKQEIEGQYTRGYRDGERPQNTGVVHPSFGDDYYDNHAQWLHDLHYELMAFDEPEFVF